MAMLEKHRNALYNHFAPQLGEEVTQALMSQFPAREVDEPTTKSDLALAVAELRLEIANVRAELKTEIADLRAEVQRMMNRQTVFLTTVIGVAVGILLKAG